MDTELYNQHLKVGEQNSAVVNEHVVRKSIINRKIPHQEQPME